jgi:hypothetical protein
MDIGPSNEFLPGRWWAQSTCPLAPLSKQAVEKIRALSTCPFIEKIKICRPFKNGEM